MRIAPLLRRSQASACATRARHCAQCVLCWPAFPLAFALRHTVFAADLACLFVGFTATMASPEFLLSVHHRLRLFVFLMRTAGVSRGRPDTNIPVPIRLRVMWPSTPAFGVAAGLTQHSLPGCLLGATSAGLATADRASLLRLPSSARESVGLSGAALSGSMRGSWPMSAPC